jgi:hypothetical protein
MKYLAGWLVLYSLIFIITSIVESERVGYAVASVLC